MIRVGRGGLSNTLCFTLLSSILFYTLILCRARTYGSLLISYPGGIGQQRKKAAQTQIS
ncbi:hypothetical protein L873DRAFT_1801311, partial [Choiromyces venosus 120613-1]